MNIRFHVRQYDLHGNFCQVNNRPQGGGGYPTQVNTSGVSIHDRGATDPIKNCHPERSRDFTK
jgi:hypothetical protein